MYIFTVTLLLFSNLVIEATSHKAIRSRKSYKKNFDSDINDCIVFPGGQSLIPELLDPKANGLERLVVYLYRNVKTNEVYVFKPSFETQALIPNIPFTSGDSLKAVTTETIVSLFNNDPMIAIQNPVITKGDPIRFNIGVVDKVVNKARPDWDFTKYPKVDFANINISDWDYKDPSQLPRVYWYPTPKQPVHGEHKPSQQQPLNQPNDQERPLNLLYDQQQTFNLPSDQHQSLNLPFDQKRLFNLPKIQQQPFNIANNQQWTFNLPNDQQQLIILPYDQKRPFNVPEDQHQSFNLPYDQQWPFNLINGQQRPFNLHNDQQQQSQLEPNIGYPPFNFDHSTADTTDTENKIFSLNPYQNKPTVQPHKTDVVDALPFNHNIYDSKENLSNKFSTFDAWFKEQMEPFRNPKLSQDNKAIDIEAIRALVQKTLLENHIHIGPMGMMRDDDGKPIDQNNLELRPILIGSPVKFQTLDVSQQFTFAQTLPYLEGILIILINPFKILGVIPLGKTFVALPEKTSHVLPSSVLQVNSPNINYASTDLSKNAHAQHIRHQSQTTTNPRALSQSVKQKLLERWESSKIKSNSNKPNSFLYSVNSDHAPSSGSFLEYYPTNNNSPFKPDSFKIRGLIATPSNDKFKSHHKSDKSVQNLVVSSINSDSNPIKTWKHYPGFNSNYQTVKTKQLSDSIETTDRGYWNTLLNAGWGYRKEPDKSHPNQQSTWGSRWSNAIKSVPSELEAETSGLKVSTWNNLDNPQIQPLAVNGNSFQYDKRIGSSRRFSTTSLQGVLQTLIDMVIGKFVGENNEDNALRRKSNETNASGVNVKTKLGSPVKKSETIDDDDRPNYRIIGGSPATGSGSPLSNKGRSGLIKI